MGKKNEENHTALHFASHNGHENIVQLLLNVFNEEEKYKLIEYVMKKNEENHTSLHYASQNGHENIVNFLLNVFGKEDIKILIEYVKKENKHNETSSHLASKQGHEKIVQLIPQKVTNMYKYQNIDEKKKSLASIIFDDECCRPGKE